ncbi:MAG TPA: hypothetical protein VGH27_02305 [Streptosporangiaceae bacterium]
MNTPPALPASDDVDGADGPRAQPVPPDATPGVGRDGHQGEHAAPGEAGDDEYGPL